MHTDIDKPIEALAVDKRLKVGADKNIGRWLTGFGVADDPDWVIGTGGNKVADIGFEGQDLCLTFTRWLEIDGYKRRIIDSDTDLFDRSDEEIVVAVFPQNRREQADQFETPDRRSEVKPRPVTGDAHVQITAKGRIPQVYRRQSALSGPFCGTGQRFRAGFHNLFIHDLRLPFEACDITAFNGPYRQIRRDVMADTDATLAEIEALGGKLAEARASIEKRFIGQKEVVELVLATLLCGGHGLLIGLPGLGKTRLVETLSTVMGLDGARVQFTPDLMPADILGSEVLETADDGSRAFRFIEGPVFCQLLMADEINRASPRTQSALLQAMQEKSVTVAGQPHALPAPFHVLATQNPIEQEGTYPLPEAQLDRFLLQIDVTYPDRQSERDILLATTGAAEEEAHAVFDAQELLAAQALLRKMPVGDAIIERILDVVRAFRPEEAEASAQVRNAVAWGPGPRAAQALMLGVRARALLDGRLAPTAQDVTSMVAPVLRHRMALTFSARAEGETLDGLIAAELEQRNLSGAAA